MAVLAKRTRTEMSYREWTILSHAEVAFPGQGWSILSKQSEKIRTDALVSYTVSLTPFQSNKFIKTIKNKKNQSIFLSYFFILIYLLNYQVSQRMRLGLR